MTMLSLEASVAPAQQRVYILGHWRSGTTWLHYALSQSSDVSYMDYWQGFSPDACLVRHPLRAVIQKLMPSTRPMDDMQMHLDLPQEDEMALLHSTGRGIYRCHYHPSKLLPYWIEESELTAQEAWYHCMQTQMIKAQIRRPGTTFLSKNPANLLRIPLLLERDPSARYIYIARDWQEVYLSTCRLYDRVLAMTAITPYDLPCLRSHIRQIMTDYEMRWQKIRYDISPSCLYSCHYDDLCADPQGIIADLCSWLRIRPPLALSSTSTTRRDYSAEIASLTPEEKHFLDQLHQYRRRT